MHYQTTMNLHHKPWTDKCEILTLKYVERFVNNLTATQYCRSNNTATKRNVSSHILWLDKALSWYLLLDAASEFRSKY
jgi:hypothetical protein